MILPEKMLKKLCRSQSDLCHKGSCGRIVVIGGSEDYTGAPFLAAMAALRTGVDIASVWCAPEAAVAIKSYAPDIIVRPLWSTSRLAEIPPAMQSMHGVLIGPGLGTSPETTAMLRELFPLLLGWTSTRRLAVVLDACAIKFVAEAYPNFRLNSSFTLTPNANEFRLLCQAVIPSEELQHLTTTEGLLARVSLELDCTIVLKGSDDLVSSHGASCIAIEEPGSYRRVAGQGDVFAGILCALSTWNTMDGGGHNTEAVVAASHLMRRCSRTVYEQPGGRSYIASDLLSVIGVEVEKMLRS